MSCKVRFIHSGALLPLAALCLLPLQAAAQSNSGCAALQSLDLPDVQVTSARSIPAGTDPQSTGAASPGGSAYPRTPAFCQVVLTLTPSSDSDIKMELWLPQANWNGRYMAVGNGAFTGSIRTSAMIEPLERGYAVSSTDTGHSGNTASFGLGHPEKVIDFGWRAVHEMAVVSKQIVDAFYGTPPEYSYWNGCSAGGRQGMVAAQKFPADFDGIIAGAPGLDWTGRAAAALRVAKHLEANPQARLLEADRTLLHTAVLEACDAGDGLEDGLISQPAQCHFDPAVLQCTGSETAACLSPAQVATARMLYASPVNPATGRAITGLLPGSEPGWTDLGWTASARDTGLEQYRYLVYGDSEWTIDDFEFERDIALAESKDSNTLNALDPNLKPFFDAGGKLIQYHGWIDPQISPANATQYYDLVTEQLGGRTAIHDDFRLFMVPGMGHCSGGPGPDSFDMVTELENWVENDIAPDSVVAEHRSGGVVDRTRPLCPFPEVAVYDGSGSIDAAENFQCRMP